MKESKSQNQKTVGKSRNWFLGILISFFSVCVTASAYQSVPLGWNSNPNPNVIGYAVYYGTNSGTYPTRVDAGTNTIVTIGNLQEGTTYYFVVKACNASGVESAPSSEIAFIVPGLVRMSMSAGSTGGATLSFPVAAGHWYEVQATTDMQTWTTIAQTPNESANSWVQYQDAPVGVTYQQRFYRVVLH